MQSEETLKQSNSSYKLIMMDYILALFTFLSMEDMTVKKDEENMFIGSLNGIDSSRRNQRCRTFFHRLILSVLHISYIKKLKFYD